MKKLLAFTLSLFCLVMISRAQNVAVNTDGSTAHSSAILDVKSTNKGMLVTRMTTAQRTAIATPANGLLVYDTDAKSFMFYNGTAWANIAGSGGGAGLSLPYDASVNVPAVAFKIANGTTAIEGSSTNGAGVYGYSENGSGINANSSAGFGILASSSQATAIRATSFNTNPTIHSSNSNETGTAVRGEATGTSGVGVSGTGASTTSYGVRGINTTGTGIYGFSTSGHGMIASSNSGVGLRTSSTTGNALEVFGKLKIYGAAVNVQNGAVLTSDAEGNATWKANRIAFRARGTGAISDLNYVHLNTNVEEYDYSNSFNAASGEFTVPVNGVYSFGTNMQYTLSNDVDDNIEFAEIQIVILRNGTMISTHTLISPYGTFFNGTDFSYAKASVAGDLKLLAGDVVRLRGIQDNSADVAVSWSGTFFGHLVFAD